MSSEDYDEARLDRWIDDPREERPSLAELEDRGLKLKGRCADCGVLRLRPDGPCGLGGPMECPIYEWFARHEGS